MFEMKVYYLKISVAFLEGTFIKAQGRAQGGCSGYPGNCPDALLDSGCPSEEKKKSYNGCRISRRPRQKK